jgi:excisionase family DNA binding protein
MIDNPTMTADEVAELVRLHRNTVQALAKSGELPGVKIGRQWRFRRSAVEQKFDLPKRDEGEISTRGLTI